MRFCLLIAAVVLFAAAWLALAPTRIGGATSYVATHGISMEPRFRTGDLALLRPADGYRVGQVVAYRSAVLKTVVLHRIHARKGDGFVLKGDNNDFLDPEHVRPAQIIGTLRMRVPRAGAVLGVVHQPAVAALLMAGAALLLLSPGRRRRRRQAAFRSPRQGDRPMTGQRNHTLSGLDAHAILVASVAAAVAFLGLGLAAFTRPATKPTTVKTPYTERVSFGYRAAAPAGDVYPRGVVRTGDPIFLKLVDRLRVTVGYRFDATAPHRVAGTQDVRLRLTGPTGWNRTFQVAPRTRFTGDRTTAEATLDLGRLQALIRRVETQSGAIGGGGYTVEALARFRTTGAVDGRPLATDYRPALSFQLDGVQLRPGAAAGAGAKQGGGFTPSRRGSVAASVAKPNMVSVRGLGLPVSAARWIALAGFLIAAAVALPAGLAQLRRPSDPAAQIHARYRRLIVPVAGIPHNAAWPSIDVASIDALAQLAERTERPLMHYRRDGVDSYLVDDGATLYSHEKGRTDHGDPGAPSPLEEPVGTAA